ncbi:MAG: metal ABC transporter permease [Rhabdochlamydiaceae bacterium]|nr:metal ABC transporter permease [Candidatus Amphrikana amoebophyrae]
MIEFFQNNIFLMMALFAAVLASFPSGIVGSYVVVKRIVFIAGSISHSVLGGMGLFLYLNHKFNLPFLTPLLGAFVFAIISAYVIGWIHLKHKQREDTVIASLWALGMSVGVIFISLTPGYNVELLHFLFGNLLWTNSADIYMLLILNGIIIITTLLNHRKFLLICFDEDQAYLQGINTSLVYFLLLSLIAITVVALVQVIGAILIIAMLCLPAATANLFTNKLSTTIMVAIAISLIFSILGTSFSYLFNWPPGATIALTATLGYFALLLFGKQKVSA